LRGKALLWRAVQDHGFVSRVVANSDGVGYPAIAPTRLGAIPLSFPPLAEQRRIAGYLDEATGTIDRLMGLRWRQMDLFKEQRAALIQQSVTRGLNPNAPLKPSGLPWQPEIPIAWKVLQVRRLISFITSGSRGWAEFYSDEGDVFVQSGNLTRSMTVDLSDAQRVTPPMGAEVERTRLARNDVLVCVTGALTGNVALVDFEPPTAFVNQHVALLRPQPKLIEPKFLSFSLWSATGQTQFKLAEYGGTKQGLSLDDVRLAFVAVPPVDEQRRILALIENETSKLDALHSAYARQLELLAEYRAALIHECVTGQRIMPERAGQP
jgi:type I restriction enzyme S subunit